MSDYYEHLEAAWNDLSKEDKEKFISSNIRQQQNPKPMTQEESLRDILNFILANPFDVHLIEEKAKLAMKLIDDNEQPIPQDINIAGEWLHDFFSEHSTVIGIGESKMSMEKWREAANGVAQLLLPELQQLREKVRGLENVSENYKQIAERRFSEIERQKSQIDELKNALNHELKVHKEFIQQAAELESLKQENERLYHFGQDQVVELELWKQRCKAAEYLISPNADIHRSYFAKWQTLKQQTHG